MNNYNSFINRVANILSKVVFTKVPKRTLIQYKLDYFIIEDKKLYLYKTLTQAKELIDCRKDYIEHFISTEKFFYRDAKKITYYYVNIILKFNHE